MIASPCIFYARALSGTVLIKAFVRAGAVITPIPGPDSPPSYTLSFVWPYTSNAGYMLRQGDFSLLTTPEKITNDVVES